MRSVLGINSAVKQQRATASDIKDTLGAMVRIGKFTNIWWHVQK